MCAVRHCSLIRHLTCEGATIHSLAGCCAPAGRCPGSSMQKAVRCNDTLQSMSWRQEGEVLRTLTLDVRKMTTGKHDIQYSKSTA